MHLCGNKNAAILRTISIICIVFGMDIIWSIDMGCYKSVSNLHQAFILKAMDEL